MPITNELIDSRSKSGKLCKLDIEKAYDHVNWDPLIYVMRRMGLGRDGLLELDIISLLFILQWWLIALLLSSLHQGDPISPLLFLLVMKVFTRMLKSASTAGLISGFSLGRRNASTAISHLLLADDMIVFCDNV